ncbi:MAG: hypothetical protein EA359_19310 [Balneolaceae bacterium]|nr:MAG: hypothetical protein EA359_19310 [Balneolaceae bacterium]
MTAVPEEAGTLTPAGGEFDRNRSLEISATPSQHWLFDRWQGDYEGTENPVVITMDSDKDIAALFIKRDYTLNIQVVGEGSVNERIVQARSSEYPQGTLVELTAIPAENWEFARWEGDLEGNENPAVITIDGETNVTAVFTLTEYPLTVNVIGQGRVDEEVVQAKTTNYPAGTLVQLTAVADENWIFTEWTGDLDGDENPAQIVVDGPTEVTATFLRTFRLTTIIEPEEDAGVITPDAGDYVRDSTFDVEATANQGWEFVRWEGDFTGSVNPFSLTMNGNKTIVAHFRKVAFVLGTDIVGQGSIQTAVLSGEERDDGFEFGSEVELTAVPNTGWRFVRWEGDLSGSDNPATITIDDTKSVTAVFSFFEGGSGTEDDPYQVINFSQLNEIRNYRSDHFILINNINASNTATSNNGLGFNPIGDEDEPFTGTFDGGGFTIADLTINRPLERYVGFFGYVEGTLRNVTLTGVNITGDERVGALAGLNDGRIEDSQADGTVNGDTQIGGIAGINEGVIERTTADVDVNGEFYVGGLVGMNVNEITDSHSTGSVMGTAFRTGGLAGENTGFIQRSSATGNVSGDDFTGGLVGHNRLNGEIRSSFASGNVTGDERVGGLVGRNDGGNPLISKSYALGNVTGNEAAGGLVGTTNGGGISESYSSGVVTGAVESGGFVGRSSTTITLSYWDNVNSTQAEATGLGSNEGITGLPTADMIGAAAEINMTDFDWVNTWRVNLPLGYPVLWWQVD